MSFLFERREPLFVHWSKLFDVFWKGRVVSCFYLLFHGIFIFGSFWSIQHGNFFVQGWTVNYKSWVVNFDLWKSVQSLNHLEWIFQNQVNEKPKIQVHFVWLAIWMPFDNNKRKRQNSQFAADCCLPQTLKLWQNKKGQIFVCHACQNDVFFTAGSWEKDIILVSITNKYLVLLISLGF